MRAIKWKEVFILKIQEYSSLRNSQNKKFGLYFKCDGRVLNALSKRIK